MPSPLQCSNLATDETPSVYNQLGEDFTTHHVNIIPGIRMHNSSLLLQTNYKLRVKAEKSDNRHGKITVSSGNITRTEAIAQ